MHSIVFTVGPAISPSEDRFSARLSVDGTASADGRSSPVLLSWLWVRRCSPPGLQRRQAEGKMSTAHWLFLLPAWKGFDFWRDSALHSDSASQEGTCEQAVVGCHKGEHQIFITSSSSLLGRVLSLHLYLFWAPELFLFVPLFPSSEQVPVVPPSSFLCLTVPPSMLVQVRLNG